MVTKIVPLYFMQISVRMDKRILSGTFSRTLSVLEHNHVTKILIIHVSTKFNRYLNVGDGKVLS